VRCIFVLVLRGELVRNDGKLMLCLGEKGGKWVVGVNVEDLGGLSSFGDHVASIVERVGLEMCKSVFQSAQSMVYGPIARFQETVRFAC
jgi:hypothetical protein